jgi:TolB-like protein/Tfp pilus assembly protein PilF
MADVQESEYRLDSLDQRLWRGADPVPISNKAFLVLQIFVRNPGRLLTKNEILDTVWADLCVSEGLIKDYVHDIRLALGDNPRKPKFIETVHGLGYRFLGGIQEIDHTAHAKPSREMEIPSLAVLPFVSFGDDSKQEYFADGISEDIITGLAKIPYLSVTSRNSTFTFKGKSVRIQDVSRELGAQYVLEGSVRKIGTSVRISAQLIDAESDRHLWAENYDIDPDDAPCVQDEVVGSIIHALGAKDGALEKSARQRCMNTESSDRNAYNYYLQARENFYRPADSGFQRAQECYEKAIALDPEFARAYSGLASLHFLRFKLFLTTSFKSIETKTLDLALHAVRLDPDDYLGHWVLGQLYGFQGKHTQSIAEFDRALHINPNDANLLVVSSEHLVYCGLMEQAQERCRLAIRLNPNCPDLYWWHLGFARFHLGNYEGALQALQKMTSPDQAQRLLSAVYAHLGRLEEARAVADNYIMDNPAFSIQEWAMTEPYTESSELQRYVNGLRGAGLPE